MRLIALLCFFGFSAFSAPNPAVLFDVSQPAVGPFPSNAFTVANSQQNTGLQVNLPAPSACAANPALTDCVLTQQLNQLDGFNVNARITVCFSASINPATLSSGIRFIPLDNAGPAVLINQVFFDTFSNCASAKPDHVLNQDSRYLLAVTESVQDADGKSAKEDTAFKQCLNDKKNAYCQTLAQAVSQYDASPNTGKHIVGGSVFTTLSATDWLESARSAVNSPLMLRGVLPAGLVSTFSLSSVKSITWLPQGGSFSSQDIPLGALKGVDRISFGLFLSPNYLALSGAQAGTIPITPTKSSIALPTAILPVSYHVFLPPASKTPAGGFPVIIFGHGLSDNQFGASTFLASTFAQQGFATLALEITGHGYGPFSLVNVNTQYGPNYLTTPGRGVQIQSGQPIGPSDGCIIPGPIATRDCGRQTAVDLFALVKAIRDTNGLGLNLNPSQIYYVGQSFGSFYGTLFHAVEPNVSAATLNVGGTTMIDVARLSLTGRPLGIGYLGGHNPSLLNVPPDPSEPYFHDLFNDNYPYRDQITANTSVKGASPIQAAFEVADWLDVVGDPGAYAPHLKTAPLSGVPAKSTLFQFGLGDLEVPNPTEAALVRAADAQASAWVFRFDMALQSLPPATAQGLAGVSMPGLGGLPILPHRFVANPTLFGADPTVPTAVSAAESSVAVAAQQQITNFFASNGQQISDPNQYLTAPYSPASQLFNPFPPLDGVLNQLNFIQIPK